jgi:hypothetical protein
MATKTAAEIKAHLKAAIEASPACGSIRVDITVHCVEMTKSKKPTTVC